MRWRNVSFVSSAGRSGIPTEGHDRRGEDREAGIDGEHRSRRDDAEEQAAQSGTREIFETWVIAWWMPFASGRSAAGVVAWMAEVPGRREDEIDRRAEEHQREEDRRVAGEDEAAGDERPTGIAADEHRPERQTVDQREDDRPDEDVGEDHHQREDREDENGPSCQTKTRRATMAA